MPYSSLSRISSSSSSSPSWLQREEGLHVLCLLLFFAVGSLSKKKGGERKRAVSEGERGGERGKGWVGLRVTSVWTVGRYWRLHPLTTTPTFTSPLCAFLSFIFSLEPGAAYRAFSTSYLPPPPPILLYLSRRCHKLTLWHMNTHIPSTCSSVFPLLLLLLLLLLFPLPHPHPLLSVPFPPPPEAAGGPWPILSLLRRRPWHIDMAGRQTGRRADRQAARNSSTPDLYLNSSLRGLIQLLFSSAASYCSSQEAGTDKSIQLKLPAIFQKSSFCEAKIGLFCVYFASLSSVGRAMQNDRKTT